ncbi:helix-turn-helix domain-containing protein [Verrucomicrobium spinosum]|uniref:helix-turn-helix domain-containing protein n=1 Tax=Verrucomicrobium spinosum TaxID=2736 RepID=UPI00017463E6|nr:helix-turn-helix domain-containing protein [Verrucomicrobium spinosum]
MPVPGSQLEFQFPTIALQRSDGAWVIKAGKPVPKLPQISAKEAAVILGCSQFSVYRYVKEGLLTAKQTKPKARLRLDRSEVEALAHKTTVE